MSQLQQRTQPLLDVPALQFWLDKAVAWGQADRPDTLKDTCLHMSRLKDYLQQLLPHINNMSSTSETMKRLPLLGQFLGRLCWNPCVTADAPGRWLLFQCLWGLYSEHPGDAVETKANQWIRLPLPTRQECRETYSPRLIPSGGAVQMYDLRPEMVCL
ncbi:Fanconi anemia group C protein homolog isoform X2 [Notothenia coriiceps]|nr:PREDICTED: Fanconi anemia group C protein homolog isoform X2 [Notothenia coriiceps]